MPVKHCCYGDCKTDSRYLSDDSVFFIPFPKPKTQFDKCRRWVRLCAREQFGIENVRRETYICSKHFVGNMGPTPEHPDPLPAVSTSFERKVLMEKRVRKPPTVRHSPPIKKQKQMLDVLVNLKTDHNYSKENDPYLLNVAENSEEETVELAVTNSPILDVGFGSLHNNDITEKSDRPIKKEMVDVGVQTNICFDHLAEFSNDELKDQKKMQRKLFIDRVLKDDESCKFYTGLTLSLLTLLFSWIQGKAKNLNYWRAKYTTESKGKKAGPKRALTLKEEFLITLIRLKRGFDVQVLSGLFGIHSSSISRIFTTWINFLYNEIKFLVSWPTRTQVKSNLPKQFKYFPKTRVIIDCTEFFMQRPSLPSSQRVTWSNYKHHNTAKALVGITPTGTFSFISQIFTGSISDRTIVEKSGFLDKLEYGDDVMADRGFLIRDLVTMKHATLNIPPFSHGRQLSSRAVTKTRRIASARIHVERAIGRMKNFKILQGVMSLKFYPILDQIVYVCGALCNLDVRLVK